MGVPGRVTPTCCQQTWEETHVSHTPGHLPPDSELLPEHTTRGWLFLAVLGFSVRHGLWPRTVLAAGSRAEGRARRCRSPAVFPEPTRGTSEAPADPGHGG